EGAPTGSGPGSLRFGRVWRPRPRRPRCLRERAVDARRHYTPMNLSDLLGIPALANPRKRWIQDEDRNWHLMDEDDDESGNTLAGMVRGLMGGQMSEQEVHRMRQLVPQAGGSLDDQLRLQDLFR